MKNAKVTAAFPGRPDEETQVRQIEVGEVISGNLAEVAIREGWASEVGSMPASVPAADAEPTRPAKPAARRRRAS